MRINLKKIVFFALLCITTKGFSQEAQKDTVSENQNVNKLVDVDVKPEFPGGLGGFYKYIGQNFKTPAEAVKNRVEGQIYVQFIIEKDGSIQQIRILKDLGYGLGDEAVRVLKRSPKWVPGSRKGITVRVMYALPLTVKA